MRNHLTVPTVLSLNAGWQAIDVFSPEKAFCMLATGVALALDTSSGRMSPVAWGEWTKLPCGPGDDFVTTPRGRVRIPRVIIALNYRALKPKRVSPTKKNVARRQGYRCAYTGKKVDDSTSSIDHVLPRSRGGSGGWDNVVVAHREVNNKKGARTPEEAGLSLLFRHATPPVRMPKDAIREDHGIKFREWAPFIGS